MNAIIILFISASIPPCKSLSRPNTTNRNVITRSRYYSIDGQRFGFPESIRHSESETRRLYGGEIILQSDFPHSAAILNQHKDTICSSFILKPKYLLTAAHCIVGTSLRHAGYGKDRHHGFWTKISRIKIGFVHPQYLVEYDYGQDKSVKKMQHDIGLVMTEQNLVQESALKNYIISNTRPQSWTEGRLDVYGYGRTSGSKTTGTLRSVSLTLTTCYTLRFKYVICGTVRSGLMGCCSGDSGGPAVIGNSVVGVVTLGALNCNPSYSPFATNLFMSVFDYADWIRNVVNASENMTFVLISRSSQSALTFVLFIPLISVIILVH